MMGGLAGEPLTSLSVKYSVGKKDGELRTKETDSLEPRFRQ